MPILEIEIVTPPGEDLPQALASQIADRAGEIFGSGPGGTWVRLHALPSSAYAESAGGPPDSVHPIFVSVLRARLPEHAELSQEARRLSEAIADICRRPPENVHVLYLPEGRGRVAFGGNLRID